MRACVRAFVDACMRVWWGGGVMGVGEVKRGVECIKQNRSKYDVNDKFEICA